MKHEEEVECHDCAEFVFDAEEVLTMRGTHEDPPEYDWVCVSCLAERAYIAEAGGYDPMDPRI